MILTAPAASGKTATAIGIVEALVTEGIVNSNNILMTSYTRAGRKAFEEKATKRGIKYWTRQNPTGVRISTFHSIFLEALNMCDSGKAIYYKPLPRHNKKGAVGREKGKESISKNLDEFEEFMEIFLNVNKDLKKEYSMENLRIYFENYSKKITLGIPPHLITKFNKYFNDNNTITFDDILFKIMERLESPDTAKKDKNYCDFFANKYKVIIIDEFQDTQPIVYKILTKLKEKNPSLLFIFIGDTNQMIYQSMNMISTNMIKSNEFYSKAVKVSLENNYRSTESLVNIFNNCIKISLNLIKQYIKKLQEKEKSKEVLFSIIMLIMLMMQLM